jgi:tetratricopeptide (TPR) repeat protein
MVTTPRFDALRSSRHAIAAGAAPTRARAMAVVTACAVVGSVMVVNGSVAAAATKKPTPTTKPKAAPVVPTTIGRTAPTTVAVKRNVSAIRLAETRVADARSRGDQRTLAEALRDLGYENLRQRNYAASITALRESVAVFRKLRDDNNLASALSLLGWASIESGKPAEAIAPLEESIALRKKLMTPNTSAAPLVEALQLLSRAQRGVGRSAEAIKTLEEVLALAAGGAKGVDSAETALIIGSIHMDAKNPAAALKYFERAVEESKGNNFKLADALQAQGWALTELGRGADAVPVLQQALKLSGPQIERTKQGVDLYMLLANAARVAGNSSVEVEARQKLVGLARNGVPGITLAEALDNVGLTLILAGRQSDAIAPLRELVDLSRKSGATARLGSALHNLGWALSAARQYPEAIENLREAVQIRRQTRDPDLVASLRFLGYALWSTKSSEATAVFTEALQTLQSTPGTKPVEIGQGYIDVASSLLFENRAGEALEPALKGLEILSANNGTDEQLGTANYNVGWAYFSTRRPNEAIPYLTKAKDIRTRADLDGAADAAEMLAAATAQTRS